jgi:hypothetical protein
VKPPEDNADHNERNRRAESKDDVCHNQAHHPDREQPASTYPVRQQARWIGCKRIDDIHQHHDDRCKRDRKPNILLAKYEKRFRKSGKGHGRRNPDNRPETTGQPFCVPKAQTGLGVGFLPDRFVDRKDHHGQGDECRHNRYPEDEAKIIRV